MTTLSDVKRAIQHFEGVQRRYQDYGAWDSEPCRVFQYFIYDVVWGDAPPQTPTDWELYYSSMNCEEADSALKKSAEDVAQAIVTCNAHDRPAMRVYIRGYCWRVHDR